MSLLCMKTRRAFYENAFDHIICALGWIFEALFIKLICHVRGIVRLPNFQCYLLVPVSNIQRTTSKGHRNPLMMIELAPKIVMIGAMSSQRLRPARR